MTHQQAFVMKKIHLLAICGMAMGSLAGMLKAKGYEVRGSDERVYPPMSDQLAQLGISYFEGFDPHKVKPKMNMEITVLSRTR